MIGFIVVEDSPGRIECALDLGLILGALLGSLFVLDLVIELAAMLAILLDCRNRVTAAQRLRVVSGTGIVLLEVGLVGHDRRRRRGDERRRGLALW